MTLFRTLTLLLASNEPLNVDPADVDLTTLVDAPDVDGLPQADVKLVSDGLTRRCQGGAVTLRAHVLAQRAALTRGDGWSYVFDPLATPDPARNVYASWAALCAHILSLPAGVQPFIECARSFVIPLAGQGHRLR